MNQTKNNSVLLILCLLICQTILAQSNIGLPIIKNYSKEIYNAGLQNWDIDQDTLGKMYFANNQGLLIFDGANWKLVFVGNKTIVRSLLIEGDRIYVGAQGDFGYFEPNEEGKLVYFSLTEKLPKEHQNIADVWNIEKHEEKIIFTADKKIFSYDGKVSVLKDDGFFTFLKKNKNKIYLQNNKQSLSYFQDDSFRVIINDPILEGTLTTGIISLDTTLLISTQKKGIFQYNGTITTPWKTNDNGFIKGHRINCLIRIDKEQIAIGTLSGGLFILDNAGKVLYHIDIDKGLQSNDIINIFKDGTGNLWLASSNGIDYIEINSPFSIIKPDKNLQGTGYAIQIHQGNIYFGASNGLYTTEWKEYYHPLHHKSFELIPNTKGQVWNLDVHNNELLLGHHEGTFRIENNKAVQISNQLGTWKFARLQDNKNLLLEGNYHGLSLYTFTNGHWQFQHQIKDMVDESCRFIEQDKRGNIWVAHPYRGLYKIILDETKQRIHSIKLYGTEDGFPSNWIYAFKIGEGVIFSSRAGIHTYNAQQDNFKLSSKWAEIIEPNSRIQHLVEDKKGNIWFVINDEVGIIRVKDLGVEKSLTKQIFPKLTGKMVGGFEQIYPYDDENVFFPLERGFMHFNPKTYGVSDTLFHVHLQEVTLGDSTVVFGGWQTESWVRPKFKHHQNAFVFKYAASEYSDFNLVEFQYLLKGLDNDWSLWTTKNIKEYTALPSGSYTFQVRAKNALGQITDIQTFKFEISPPWYATIFAKILYGLVIIGLLVGLVVIPYQQYEQEKENLKQEQEKTLQETTQEYQKIVAENQAEIKELQQEKHKSEIQFKNQELATTTMHLVQKGELMNKLKENLNTMLKNTNEPKLKKEIRATLQLINKNAKLDEDWKQFAKYFDQVHIDFLKRLKETYPQLTPKDQRLCTYLKMNLSTKEILPLMNISLRGVEVSRYRLRKKLGLESDVNLNEFMMNF